MSSGGQQRLPGGAGGPPAIPLVTRVETLGSTKFQSAYGGHETSPSGQLAVLYVVRRAAHAAAFLSALREEAAHTLQTDYELAYVPHSWARLNALNIQIARDGPRWRARGIELAQWGPDAASSKVAIMLRSYTAAAEGELLAAYGPDWVWVSHESLEPEDAHQGESEYRQAREQARRSLRAWAGFPADHDPRPLVLLSPCVRPGPFPDGKTKLAFVRGLIEAAPGFPAEILQALRPRHQQTGPPEAPLLVTTAALSTADFLTDRGQRQLPAWEVHARGVPEPIWVLDPATRQQAWLPPGLEDHELTGDISRAHLGTGGRTITLSFTGIPREYADYPRAEVLEAGSAVAIVPVPVDIGPPGPRHAHAQQREVTTVLAQPLGPRVLLDGHGSPVVVLG